MRETLVLCALPYEAEVVKSFLKKGKRIKRMKRPCFRGYLGNRRVYLMETGAGKYFYEQKFSEFLEEQSVDEVIFFGTAGALHGAIKVGDVVVANREISWADKGDKESEIGPVVGAVSDTVDLRPVARRFGQYWFNVYKGCIITRPEPVLDPGLKSLLHGKYKADAVDMESGYGARICREQGIPFMVVRAVSDAAEPVENSDMLPHRMTAVIHGSFLVGEILAFKGLPDQWITGLE
jgi:nucleoside phosphorylase